jgi:hypothetical protein
MPRARRSMQVGWCGGAGSAATVSWTACLSAKSQVAGGEMEQRFPKPCAEVRFLPGAQSESPGQGEFELKGNTRPVMLHEALLDHGG